MTSKLILSPRTSDLNLIRGEYILPWAKVENKTVSNYSILEDKRKKSDVDNYKKDLPILYHQIISMLSISMNKIHGTNYTNKYWEVALGFDVMKIITDTYDCLTFLIHAIGKEQIQQFVTVGIGKESYKTDNFNSGIGDLNLQLMSIICSSLGIPIIKKSNYIPSPNNQIWTKKPSKKIISLGSALLVQLLGFLSTKKSFLINSQLSFKEKLYLLVISRGNIIELPYNYHFKLLSCPVDEGKRALIRTDNLGSNEKTIQILIETISHTLSKAFVEKFDEIQSQVQKLIPYVNNNSIKVSNICATYSNNPVERIFLAELIRKYPNAKLIGMPHGAYYGQINFHDYEYYEYSRSDIYATWGWKTREREIPMPALKLNVLEKKRPKRQKKKHKKNKILWIGLYYESYVDNRYRNRLTDGWPYNRADLLLDFLQNLSTERKESLTLRFKNFENDHFENDSIISDELSKITLSNSKKIKFIDEVLESDLVVIDQLVSTSMLELIKLGNIPFIIYDKKSYFNETLTDLAKEKHLNLINTGVTYTSPEDAAEFVNSQDIRTVQEWWNNKDRQTAITGFSKTFGYTTSNVLKSWNAFLK